MSDSSPWGAKPTKLFYELTPEKILDALEQVLDVRCTGRAFAHNSMENRVYELEIDIDPESIASRYERSKVVKFYRPDRWTREQILEEHIFLEALIQNEVPVVAPVADHSGNTLFELPQLKLFFAVFPKVGGRSPQELDAEQVAQVGRLLARMHNVGHSMSATERISLDPQSYGLNNLQLLVDGKHIPSDLQDQYRSLVLNLCEQIAPHLQGIETIQIHGDCHLGNLLWSQQGPFWVDFDDSVIGPPIQDLWLMILGRDQRDKDQLHQLIRSYELLREFDWDTLRLIEPLRTLRMIHFSGWIAKRYQDPAFQRAFPDFGSQNYWRQQIQDLQEQTAAIREFSWY